MGVSKIQNRDKFLKTVFGKQVSEVNLKIRNVKYILIKRVNARTELGTIVFWISRSILDFDLLLICILI